MPSTNSEPQTVVAVERAFSVLRTLGAARESLGVSAIARSTGLAKSTVSRLINTLEALEMVERPGNHPRYRLGPGLGPLTPGTGGSLIEVARPYLRELVEEFDEDAGMAVRDGFDIVYVDQISAPGAIGVQNWTGERFPAHVVAAGFVLMRAWSEADLAEYLATPIAAFTSETVTDPGMVRVRLGDPNDYVWTHSTFAEDLNGVAAPICRGADVVAAINLYGPSYRFPGGRSEAEIGSRLVEVAARVSSHLNALSLMA